MYFYPVITLFLFAFRSDFAWFSVFVRVRFYDCEKHQMHVQQLFRNSIRAQKAFFCGLLAKIRSSIPSLLSVKNGTTHGRLLKQRYEDGQFSFLSLSRTTPSRLTFGFFPCLFARQSRGLKKKSSNIF